MNKPEYVAPGFDPATHPTTAAPVLRIFPPPAEERSIAGLYLSEPIRHEQGPAGLPFIYTNFISSLDGRISTPDPATGRHAVPAAVANPRDGALYLELAAHADVLLTTARHLRALAAGRYHEVIELHTDARLAAWRHARGLSPQPALAAVSASLAIPLAALRARYQGPLLIITGSDAPVARMEELRAAGVEVEQLPRGAALDGGAVAQSLAARGHHCVYSIAGPRVAHALFAAGILRRLYLTLGLVMLGGRDFDPLTVGDVLSPPARFALRQLHLDAHASQLFASFDCTH